MLLRRVANTPIELSFRQQHSYEHLLRSLCAATRAARLTRLELPCSPSGLEMAALAALQAAGHGPLHELRALRFWAQAPVAVPAHALAALATLPGLRELSLRGCVRLERASATVLAAVVAGRLDTLSLALCRLEADGALLWPACVRLQQLDLSGCEGALAGHLAALPPSLRSLDVSGRLTAHGFACSALDDAAAASLAASAAAPDLEQLHAAGCRGVSVGAWDALLPALPRLAALDLEDAHACNALAARVLATGSRLTHLSVAFTCVDLPPLLLRMPAPPPLESLHLDGCLNAQPAALASAMARLPRLRLVTLQRVPLSAAALQQLHTARPDVALVL